MKKHLNLTILLFVLAFASCQKEAQLQHEESPQIISAARAGGSQYSYLSVEVVDVEGNKIKSDALSTTPRPYVDGRENVRAEIQHSNGDFYMMTNTLTAKPARRFFKFPGNESLENKNDYRIRVRDDLDAVSLQSMSLSTPESMVMHLWSFDSKGNKLLDIIFNPSTDPGTDQVTVTRTSASTWEVVPSSNANAVIKQQNATDKIESMPFKFILTKIN